MADRPAAHLCLFMPAFYSTGMLRALLSQGGPAAGEEMGDHLQVPYHQGLAPDGSLSQVVYPENKLISRRRWKHSHVLADHFWARFIRLYVPSLQTCQKWQATLADIDQNCEVMITDP